MNSFKLLVLSALISCSFFTNQAFANFKHYTVELPHLDGSTSIETSNEGDSFFIEDGISGLPKFDPIFGSLTAITFDINLDYVHIVSIDAENVINPGQGHSAEYATTFTDIELIYKTPGASYNLGSKGLQDSLGCGSGGGGSPCGNGFSHIDDWIINDFGSPTGKPGYNAADFIGSSENVEKLELWFVSYQYALFLENIDDISVEEEFFIPNGSITINYEYSPVPLPAASWLFMTAMLGFFGCFRKKKT